MKIFELEFENWYTLSFSTNWIALLGSVAVICGLVYIIKKIVNRCISGSIEVDEVSLGIGDSSIKLKYNKKDQEIAYKLWVELNTRKIGLQFDENNDVIDEVYNSWYAFFAIARELLKDIPRSRLQLSTELITLTTKVLNEGLRPHLTIWQAKYRKWYRLQDKDERSPQEIQRDFPEYSDLINDLLKTNIRMIEYKNLMYQIAFGK